MKNPLSYTYDGLERELNLLEIHLKEAPKGDEAFCQDCINKHISTARGFALEGPGFTQNKNEQERFLNVEKQLREIKDKNYKEQGVELSQKVRQIRKNLYDKCPECIEELGEDKVKAIKNLTKNLNTPLSFNNQINLKKSKMVTYTELGYMNAGQFAAEGIRYAVDSYKPDWSKYVGIGGGVGLQMLGLFVKMPTALKTISLIAGSNLLARGVIDMVKKTTTSSAGIRTIKVGNSIGGSNSIGGYAGKSISMTPSFGGPTFQGRVTAQNIPSQYARAGILAGAQAFESPEHADLIRVD